MALYSKRMELIFIMPEDCLYSFNFGLINFEPIENIDTSEWSSLDKKLMYRAFKRHNEIHRKRMEK